MSPPPAAPVDPELPGQMSSLTKNGLIASALAGSAMTARVLVARDDVSPAFIIRRVLTACIVGFFCGLGLERQIEDPGLRSAAIGAIGYSSPECLDFLLRFIKAKGAEQVAKAEAKLKPSKSRERKRKKK
jgi:hypothetical protein